MWWTKKFVSICWGKIIIFCSKRVRNSHWTTSWLKDYHPIQLLLKITFYSEGLPNESPLITSLQILKLEGVPPESPRAKNERVFDFFFSSYCQRAFEHSSRFKSVVRSIASSLRQLSRRITNLCPVAAAAFGCVDVGAFPRAFRFSRVHVIIIFHSSIPLPLGDIVLRACARVCVGFTWVNAAQVSVINCHRAGSRGAVINFERTTESFSFSPPPRFFLPSFSLSRVGSSRARQFTGEFHCRRRMPTPSANGSPRSNIGPPNSLPNSLRNTFLMNYCCRKWK